MISNFIKFNESLENVIDKLKNDVTNAFAYISDDNTSTINVRDNEVYVVIDTILPSNVIYDDIKDYINKYELWNETLLDINVAIEQLTSRGNIGYFLNINTVGNVRIRFHLISDKLFTENNLSITLSKTNLIRLIGDKKIVNINNSGCCSQSFIINFSEVISPDYQREIAREIKDIFYKNGIVDVGMVVTGTREIENIQIRTYSYPVDNLTVFIYKLRDNNKNAFKNIKLQNII
jgi:hypothetical protein